MTNGTYKVGTTKGIVAWLLGVAASSALAATVTLTPQGPSTVRPGQLVTFDLVISTGTLPSFSGADVVIGSNEAAGLSFAYHTEWQEAFSNVSPVTVDVGFYKHDVFVGGNNPTSVGTSLSLGVVTIETAGLAEGTYEVRVDPVIDQDISKLYLFVPPARQDEALHGFAQFTVRCQTADADCDNDVDLLDYGLFTACLGGPGKVMSGPCARFDHDGDDDVDLADAGGLWAGFSGSR